MKANETKGKASAYLSRSGALEQDPGKVYNTLFKLQRELGCTYRELKVNDRQFDSFVGQAYMKSMTERKTGRTCFLIGKDQHGVAGQEDFDIDPNPYVNKTGKGFGNLIRWAHLGNTFKSGIVLVDFELNGSSNLGNARNVWDVQGVLQYLSTLGFSPRKKIYLTDCVRIHEPEIGRMLRESRGVNTLEDWITDDFQDIRLLTETPKTRSETSINVDTRRSSRTEESRGEVHPMYRASSALTESWG